MKPARAFLCAALAVFALATAPYAHEHGTSAYGTLALPQGFAHFPYAEPTAPKGGELSLVGASAPFNANLRTFDSFNNFILKGAGAQGVALTFDSLMTRNDDEDDAVYGLLAQSVAFSRAQGRAVFTLRDEARFHDGTPLRAEDAAYTLNLLKAEGHPLIRNVLRAMREASADAAGRLVVNLTPNPPRGALGALAQLPVFSRAELEARPFNETTLTPFLGSGPYRVEAFEPGRFVAYRRDPDYWGANLNVNRGRHNFDVVRYEYFRDDSARFLAFQKGEYLLHEENIAHRWATGYDFPAAQEGRIRRLVLPDARPSGAQGWFFNMRRAPFDSLRVREAFNLVFDFPWMNRTLFHNQYLRTESFFDGSPLKAPDAPPTAQARALLAPFAASLPADVLTAAPRKPPRADGTGRDRALARRAARLLDEAGWRVSDGKRVDAEGRPLRATFLIPSAPMERVTQPYAQALRALGVDARLRRVDAAQYQRRLLDFDFDIAVARFALAPLPDESWRALWGAREADTPGSRNLAGIRHEAVDALIESALAAETEAEARVAAHALDVVLRALTPWTPQWRNPSYRLAFWDVFGRPARAPRLRRGVVDLWWRAP